MIELNVDRVPVRDWAELIALTDDREFQKLTRSTVPLLDFWRSPEQRLDEYTSLIDRPLANPSLHFEYAVPSVGRAKASFTDLMILSRDSVVGVEAKSTEPMYERVIDWLRAGGPNREVVLDHWCQLIGRVPESRDMLDACVYQMVHRLASVMSVDRPDRYLVYHLFPRNRDGNHYVGELGQLAATFALGDDVSILVLETPIVPTDHADRAATDVVAANPTERPMIVRRALLEGPLFTYGPTTSTRLR